LPAIDTADPNTKPSQATTWPDVALVLRSFTASPSRRNASRSAASHRRGRASSVDHSALEQLARVGGDLATRPEEPLTDGLLGEPAPLAASLRPLGAFEDQPAGQGADHLVASLDVGIDRKSAV